MRVPRTRGITYADALPGASFEYTVSSGAVGEEIHLNGDQAPSTFVFDVRASAGMRASKKRNGTIALTNADGHRVFGLAPSYAYADRSRQDTEPVDTDLEAIDGGWRITLSVDPGWLHRALAGGPVTIDPIVYIEGATQDCALSSDAPSVSYCAVSQLWVGYNGDHDHHSLVKWDLSAIPEDAAVVWGDASLFQDGSAPAMEKSLSLHRMTRDWTNDASWATYDGTHAWSTPGGDFDPTPAATATVAENQTGWTDWSVTSLVQHWVDGSLPNYGVAVQDAPGLQVVGEEDFLSTEGAVPAQAPELDIAWSPRTGNLDAYTLENQSLDAKTTAGLNVANGNLLLTTNDITSPGTGLDLRFDHYYNSLLSGHDSAALGVRMTASVGRDLRLRIYYTDIIGFERGDGVQLPFLDPVTSGSSTTWTAPYELGNASLSRNNSTETYTLRLPDGLPSQPGKDLTLTFDNTGKLTSLADQAGHAIGMTYYPGGHPDWPTLHGITDTTGAAWTVSRGSLDEERIADILSPDNRHTTFSYLTSGRYLRQVTEADGTTSRYGYDGNKRITSITGPGGNVTKVRYSGDTTKVASLIRTTDAAHTTGPTTTITYSSPSTPCRSAQFDYTKNVISRPDGTSTTYCANNHAQVTYDTDDPTAATPSGEWYDLHDRYTQGTGTHSVTIAGADAGAGVKKLSLERGSSTEMASSTLPCDPRYALDPTACPHTSTRTLTFDANAIPEGAHTFHARTTDYAGRSIVSPDWTVKIDRTAPQNPSDFLGDFDEETGEGDIDWLAQDPVLADGSPGSGIVAYEYRYSRPGQPLSTMQVSAEPGFRFPNAVVGELVHVEVTAVDGVGNRSATVTANVAIGSEGDCQVDPDAVDSIDASLHLSNSGQPVDAFTFDQPKTSAAVRAALPAGTQVLSMLERQPGTDVDSQTSAITLIPSMTFDQSVGFWNKFVSDDTDDFEDYLRSARATANETDRGVIDQQLESLSERRQIMSTYGGVLVRSFAIAHNPAAAQAITNHFGSQLQLVRTTAVAGERSEGCPTIDSTGARARSLDTGPEQVAPLAAGDGASGPAETGVRAGSYSPFRVRVATYVGVIRPTNDGDYPFHKVVAAWRFGASSNRYYWFRGYRRNDGQRGVEAQVDMNADHAGNGFGAPPWGFLPPDDDGTTQAGVPNVWTASYRCAYPDDYLNDDVHHGYSLTVGMGCRPRSNRFRYRWAHLVTNEDDIDSVRPSVQPTHYARPDHDIPNGSELGYCHDQDDKRGSCFFAYHGVAVKTFTKTTNGGTVLRTPGQALFER